MRLRQVEMTYIATKESLVLSLCFSFKWLDRGFNTRAPFCMLRGAQMAVEVGGPFRVH